MHATSYQEGLLQQAALKYDLRGGCSVDGTMAGPGPALPAFCTLSLLHADSGGEKSVCHGCFGGQGWDCEKGKNFFLKEEKS